MARGNDPGKDFDAQWKESKRRGKEKAQRGETHWATDRYLERDRTRLSGPPAHHAGARKSCFDRTVMLMSFLSGLGWVISETVSRIA